MHHRNILVFSSGVVAALFGYYISLNESEPQHLDPITNKSTEQVQILNRGEPKITKKPGFSQIGRFQAKIPKRKFPGEKSQAEVPERRNLNKS